MINCTFCASRKLQRVLDMGTVALAGGFVKPDQFATERKYPLALMFCEDCFALQVEEPVDADTLFREYFYFSSASRTVRDHFAACARTVADRFQPETAIEIGCNDGVLLTRLADHGIKAFGFDPSSAARAINDPRVTVANQYFTETAAKQVGKVDMVLANNVFAHVQDIHALTRAVLHALRDDGVFVLEAHHLGAMVRGLQYDWIYHEHLFYYSLLSLQQHFRRYAMEVFDVEPVALHGGSMRYYISRAGRHQASPKVEQLERVERFNSLDRVETFRLFAQRVDGHKQELRDMVAAHQPAGYGASGRANALIQAAGLELPYIVDDAPAKHGYYTPGSHIPIKPSSELDRTALLFAWTYRAEILGKCGHGLIVPLPDIEVLTGRMAA